MMGDVPVRVNIKTRRAPSHEIATQVGIATVLELLVDPVICGI